MFAGEPEPARIGTEDHGAGMGVAVGDSDDGAIPNLTPSSPSNARGHPIRGDTANRGLSGLARLFESPLRSDHTGPVAD